MKRTLNLFALLIIGIACNAQFIVPQKELCNKLPGRKLLVVLLDDENNNERLNDYLKAKATETWKFGAVEFILDPAEVSTKLKGVRDQYAVLTFSRDASTIKGWSTVGNSSSVGTNGTTNTREYGLTDRFRTSFFGIILKLADGGNILPVCINTPKIDSLDIHFFMEQMNLLIDASLKDKDVLDFGKTHADFTAKKLYLNEADFSESGKKYVEKNHTTPYEFLSPAEFTKMVLEGKKEGVYLRVCYSQEMLLNVVVPVDIKTSRIYARVRHSGSDCKNVTFTNGNEPAEMNVSGICAKQIHYLYDYKAQDRKYGNYSYQD